MTKRGAVVGPRFPDPPAVEPQGGGGGGSEWRFLTRAKNQIIAHLIKGLLEELEIPVHLDSFDPSLGAYLKPFGDPNAPVAVWVQGRDFDQASLALLEVDHAPVDEWADGPVRARRWFWFTLLVVIAVGILLVGEMMGSAPCLIRAFCF